MNDEETRTYEITMKPEQLNVLEAFFRTMTVLGKIGASRKLVVFVDGDGAVHPTIKRNGEELNNDVYDEDMGCGVVDYECEIYNPNPRENNWKYRSEFRIYYDLG